MSTTRRKGRRIKTESLPVAHALLRTPGCSEQLALFIEYAIQRAWNQPFELDIWRVASDANHPSREIARDRVAKVCLSATLVDLADDLADDDLDASDMHFAPTALLHLASLVSQWFPLHLFAEACSGQHLEVSTSQSISAVPSWTLARYMAVAEATGGAQFAGHLHTLWAGSPLENRCEEIGRPLGVATFVMLDFTSRDQRLLSLTEADRREVLQRARSGLQKCTLAESGLAGANRLAAKFESAFWRITASKPDHPRSTEH